MLKNGLAVSEANMPPVYDWWSASPFLTSSDRQKMVTVLTAQTFLTEINSSIPIIIDFWASWCGPCKMLAPIFEELSKDKEYQGKLRFAKLSTEEYPDIAGQQEITGIPCLILFKNGKEVDRIIGFAPQPLLKQKIDSVLEKI